MPWRGKYMTKIISRHWISGLSFVFHPYFTYGFFSHLKHPFSRSTFLGLSWSGVKIQKSGVKTDRKNCQDIQTCRCLFQPSMGFVGGIPSISRLPMSTFTPSHWDSRTCSTSQTSLEGLGCIATFHTKELSQSRRWKLLKTKFTDMFYRKCSISFSPLKCHLPKKNTRSENFVNPRVGFVTLSRPSFIYATFVGAFGSWDVLSSPRTQDGHSSSLLAAPTAERAFTSPSHMEEIPVEEAEKVTWIGWNHFLMRYLYTGFCRLHQWFYPILDVLDLRKQSPSDLLHFEPDGWRLHSNHEQKKRWLSSNSRSSNAKWSEFGWF